MYFITPDYSLATQQVNNVQVLYKFLTRLPNTIEQSRKTWLVELTWQYCGHPANGMPIKSDSEQMHLLEQTLTELPNKYVNHLALYASIGNHVKQNFFQVANLELFLQTLRDVLKNFSEFSITVNYRKDTSWSALNTLLNTFNVEQAECINA